MMTKKMIKVFLKVVFLLLVAGCGIKYQTAEDPFPIPIAEPCQPMRLALVLGGGGARGMAHLGVLEEFEKANIPIDMLVGCSVGGIVGALYADCPSAQAVRRLLEPLKKWDILDVNIRYCRYGIVHGRSLKKFLNQNLKAKYFEELQIPLYVVATDLIAGEMIIFSKGSIIPAVHASSAVPFLFAPVLYYGRMLVDGGVINPIPVVVAKQVGADLVVAVDLSQLIPKTCPEHLFGVAKRSAEIKFLAQSAGCIENADIIIRPDLGDIGMFDDSNNRLMYEAGRQAALKAIPKIIEALAERGVSCGHKCQQNIRVPL